MKRQRLFQTIKLHLFKGKRRIQFMKNTFFGFGDNVSYYPRVMPLYPELIRFGNNIVVAKGVDFVTHDAIHIVLNNYCGGYKERVGCIDIGDNVFLGVNSVVMYNTKIGNDVIVGANTFVNKDLESDSVYIGIPARRICSFREFVDRRKKSEPINSVKTSQIITKCEVDALWNEFLNVRNKN